MPAMGPVIGSSRRRSMISIQTGGRHHRTFAGALQFETVVDEVVGRPRAGVAKGQLALVLAGDVLYPGVELVGLLALDQEGCVHDHFVADGLARAGRHGRVPQEVTYL